GDARASQLTMTLPQGSAGARHIQVTVTTDNYGQIFEYTGAGTAETNNSATTTVTAALAPYADLAVSNVTAPSLTVGDPARVTVSWTVANQGTGTGTVDAWTDAIIASSDGDPSHGVTLAQFTHQGLLQAADSYTRSETFLL